MKTFILAINRQMKKYDRSNSSSKNNKLHPLMEGKPQKGSSTIISEEQADKKIKEKEKLKNRMKENRVRKLKKRAGNKKK